MRRPSSVVRRPSSVYMSDFPLTLPHPRVFGAMITTTTTTTTTTIITIIIIIIDVVDQSQECGVRLRTPDLHRLLDPARPLPDVPSSDCDANNPLQLNAARCARPEKASAGPGKARPEEASARPEMARPEKAGGWGLVFVWPGFGAVW